MNDEASVLPTQRPPDLALMLFYNMCDASDGAISIRALILQHGVIKLVSPPSGHSCAGAVALP